MVGSNPTLSAKRENRVVDRIVDNPLNHAVFLFSKISQEIAKKWQKLRNSDPDSDPEMDPDQAFRRDCPKKSLILSFISLSTSDSVSLYTLFMTLSVFQPPRLIMYWSGIPMACRMLAA